MSMLNLLLWELQLIRDFVLNISTHGLFMFVCILLKEGNHDMLYIAHLRNMATEIFKALHGSTTFYIRDRFEEKDKIYN